MKNIFIFILMIWFTVIGISCNKDAEPSLPPNSVPKIIVKDANGNNLLDPANKNGFSTDIIRIYYIRDGKPKLQFSNVNDNFYFFDLTKNESEYAIGIYVDISEKETTTLIKWNEHDTDTMICTIKDRNRLTRIMYNNELKWEDPSGRNRSYFTIIK